MENSTNKEKKKYVNWSLDVLLRTQYAKDHPEVIKVLSEQYDTAPRYVKRAIESFNKDHVLAADKWMHEEITDEQFITFCGGTSAKLGVKNRMSNNKVKAERLHYRILKAKMKGKIV